MRPLFDTDADLLAETEAGITWMSGELDWRRVALPIICAIAGVLSVGYADAASRWGLDGAVPLWWIGVLFIFVPAAAVLLYTRVSRNEAIAILMAVGLALYAVKLLYAPGALWGFDELLHYHTLDNLLSSGHLFTPNTLLPVSPFYPGLESVTAAIVRVTGLPPIRAGLMLIGVVRLMSVVAIFLLLERFAAPSRFAAPATLLYMACPAFLYFDTMFSYESLALALSLVTLFVLATAQLEEGSRRRRLNVVGALLLLTVVVTHHVTSFILLGALVAWTLFQIGWTMRSRRKARRAAAASGEPAPSDRLRVGDLPGSLWVTLVGAVAVTAWLLNVASVTIDYLFPQLMSGVTSVVRLITHESSGRQLFASPSGHTAPLLERAIGIGSVLVILAFIPISLKYLWERRHSSVLSHFFALGALGYPAILALRFTSNGWDVGSRATAFIYLPLAFTVAAGMELLVSRRWGNSVLMKAALVVAAGVIFAGGIIAGISPGTRMPSPYDPGIAEVPYDPESIAASQWAAETLGPGHRTIADFSQSALIGSVGRQYAVTPNETQLDAIFLAPQVDAGVRSAIASASIEYALVDRRIAGSDPVKGFFYTTWEKATLDYGSRVPTSTVDKFSNTLNVSKVFDSGNVQLFDLRRLWR